MKKRIHLTESQLHKLIEQALNEISTQTKMSAANKARQEWDKYGDEILNDVHPFGSDAYKRASRMNDKRKRQMDKFIKGVEDDVNNTPGLGDTNYLPTGTGTRGAMLTKSGVKLLNKHGLQDFGIGPEGHKKLRDTEQFINGNSYYEPGRGWTNPDDEGYDMERSEPWARIRQKNESVAHRVTESIMRKLRRM